MYRKGLRAVTWAAIIAALFITTGIARIHILGQPLRLDPSPPPRPAPTAASPAPNDSDDLVCRFAEAARTPAANADGT